MEYRPAKLIVNKSGSGSNTFRATLPTSFVREMGLDEDERNLEIAFDETTQEIKIRKLLETMQMT